MRTFKKENRKATFSQTKALISSLKDVETCAVLHLLAEVVVVVVEGEVH